MEFQDRPLIRVSSTYFWHFPRNHLIVPIPELKRRADERRTSNFVAGSNEGDEETYEPITAFELICK